LWNLPLDDVFVAVGVTINGSAIDQFNTPTTKLNPWEKKVLTGFFDATNAQEGRYLANLKVNYEGSSTNKIVAIYVKKIPVDNRLTIALIIAGILVLLSIIIIVYLSLRIKKLKNFKEEHNEKKKKK
jgi:hypothetical protein